MCIKVVIFTIIATLIFIGWFFYQEGRYYAGEFGCFSNASKVYRLDQCHPLCLTFWGHKMNETRDASHGNLELYLESPPCLIWIWPNELRNEFYHHEWVFTLCYCKTQSKLPPASWLDIALSALSFACLMLFHTNPPASNIDQKFWIM